MTTGASVLTIVRNRAVHLAQLVEGLRRSATPPAELVVVDMSDEPVVVTDTPFPVSIVRLDGGGLPLARARNLAARAASGDRLIFLDVDCIPLGACLTRLDAVLATEDALLCADVRYLGPGDADPGWSEASLLACGRAHPVRAFPADGVRREPNPGLFWSLAFAIRRDRFESLGGFDEAFVGYGAEDTDFGFRAAEAGLPLLFVGGAVACHQHHAGHQPPVQHLDDILRNATLFHARWGRWPMEGWLDAFDAMGLILRTPDRLSRRRPTTTADLDGTAVTDPF
jgi:GT2 family glycosyltransferase